MNGKMGVSILALLVLSVFLLAGVGWIMVQSRSEIQEVLKKADRFDSVTTTTADKKGRPTVVETVFSPLDIDYDQFLKRHFGRVEAAEKAN